MLRIRDIIQLEVPLRERGNKHTRNNVDEVIVGDHFRPVLDKGRHRIHP